MTNASKERKQAVTALKTCYGQIEGILKMLEEGRYCIDISNQLMSAQSQLARANKLILIGHLESCVIDTAGDKDALKEKTDELIAVLNKLLK